MCVCVCVVVTRRWALHAESLNSLVAYLQSLNSTKETNALLVAIASQQNWGVNKIMA
jgi:hypothetical protein